MLNLFQERRDGPIVFFAISRRRRLVKEDRQQRRQQRLRLVRRRGVVRRVVAVRQEAEEEAAEDVAEVRKVQDIRRLGGRRLCFERRGLGFGRCRLNVVCRNVVAFDVGDDLADVSTQLFGVVQQSSVC